MMRNDYRRTMILLRTLRKGSSGHARLERRTLMGSLYITLSSVQTDCTLHAVLLGSSARGSFGHILGTFRPDGHGGAGLSVSFDPRNLSGHDLDAFEHIVVVENRSGSIFALMAGGINGGRAQQDWLQINQAAEDLFESARSERRITLLPEGGGHTKAASDIAVFSPAAADCADDNIDNSALPPSAQNDEPDDSAIFSAPDADDSSDNIFLTENAPQFPDEADGQNDSDESRTENDEEIPSGEENTADEPLANTDDTEISEESPFAGICAQDMHTIDALRMLLDEYNLSCENCDLVQVPLPAACGYDFGVIGINRQNNREFCLALPGVFSPQPPAGLEAYFWLGKCNKGWWLYCDEAQTLQ